MGGAACLQVCIYCSHSLAMAELMSERQSVKLLLSINSKSLLSPISKSVADNSSEIACGWKLARGCPEYNCIPKTKKTRKLYSDMSSSPSKHQLCKSSCTVVAPSSSGIMGGKLTENLDYVYSGGLSSRVRGNASPVIPPLTHLQRQSPVLALNPILEYRSQTMTEATRNDLSRLVQMQMRPDISYEQMIIEQRLRSMDLNMLPSLSVTGFSKSKQSSGNIEHSARPVVMHVQSISKPPARPHPNNIHVKHSPSYRNRKRQRLKPVKWCALAKQPPSFAKQPENTIYYRSSFSRLLESSNVASHFESKNN